MYDEHQTSSLPLNHWQTVLPIAVLVELLVAMAIMISDAFGLGEIQLWLVMWWRAGLMEVLPAEAACGVENHVLDWGHDELILLGMVSCGGEVHHDGEVCLDGEAGHDGEVCLDGKAGHDGEVCLDGEAGHDGELCPDGEAGHDGEVFLDEEV